MSLRPLKRIVFFASGSGSNFQAVIDCIQQGELDAQIVGLVVNKVTAGAIHRAEKAHIPWVIFTPNAYESYEVYAQSLLHQLTIWNPDLIVLAGYLQKIPTVVLDSFPDKMINIHPSLLPKFGGKGFYGLNVHRAVVEAGERETGCTVHVVTPDYDEGPIIGQRKVPVFTSDAPEDVQKRVLTQEHLLLPEVIRQFLSTSK